MNSNVIDVRTPSERRVPVVTAAQAVGVTDEQLENGYFIPDYDMHLMPDHATAYPAGGRLYWDTPGVADEFARVMRGMFAHPFHKYPVKTALSMLQVVNGTGKEVYRLADGRRTGREVYLELLKKHDEPYGKHQDKIYAFMRGMLDRRHAYLSPTPRPNAGKVTGSEEYFYPAHMSIEVTSNCNIRCIHCYGTFEQARFDAIDADHLIRSLERMKADGLKQVELTGGECTTHPEFPRILEYCAENFQLVGVLTNGVGLRESIFDVLGKHPHNCMVQICINGNQQYHDMFTKVKHSYRRAMESITRIAQFGVAVRAPMNLTFENHHMLEETGEAVREAGALIFLASWVDVSYGRAQDLGDDGVPRADYGAIDRAAHGESECATPQHGMSCNERAATMASGIERLDRLAQKYPGFVRHRVEGSAKEFWEWEKACGAGRRSLYLASNGRLGLCPMSVETGIPGFGRLDPEGRITTAVDTTFAKHFASVPAPNPRDCWGCPHELEHRGCLLHGIRQYMKTPHTCTWGQKNRINILVENGFHSLKKKPDGSYDFPEMGNVGSGCGHASKSEPQVLQLGKRK